MPAAVESPVDVLPARPATRRSVPWTLGLAVAVAAGGIAVRLGHWAAFRGMGFDARMPAGTFYLYVKMPKGVKNGRRFANADEFSEFLITEKLISTVPWDDAGSYIRFSATFESKGLADEKRVLNEFKKRMSGLEFEF